MHGHSPKDQTSPGMLAGHQAGRDMWKDFSDSTGNKAEPVGLGLMALSTCFVLVVSVRPSIACTSYNNTPAITDLSR